MDARRIVSQILEIMMVAILGAMVLLVFGNVVARYLFDAAITWAEEVARFLFVWLTYVGATFAAYKGLHLGIDLVVVRLGSRPRIFTEIFKLVVILAFLAVWAIGGVALVEANLNYMSPATGFSMGFVYLIGPLAAVLITYDTALKLVAAIRELRREN
jgi:TRAP-type C4-dicarboxylate transport system permease small subunit